MNENKTPKSPHSKIVSKYPKVSTVGRSVVLEFSNIGDAKNMSADFKDIFSLLINSNIDVFTFFDNVYDDYRHFSQISIDEIVFYQRIDNQESPSGVY